MIVKCQLPLEINGVPTVLIYNKSRELWAQEPVTKEWIQKFDGKLKIYCHGRFVDDQLVLGAIVQDQDW